jgi:hypothetical protein
MIVSPPLLDRLLEAFHLWHKTRNDSFFVNAIENRGDDTLQVLSALAIEISQFFFEIPEEEEVAGSKVWAVGWTLQPCGSLNRQTFLRPPLIARTCIVLRGHKSLQRLPTTIRSIP